MDNTRCKKGEERLRQMKYANSIGPKLAEISPELNRYRKEFAFGDVPAAKAFPRATTNWSSFPGCVLWGMQRKS